MLHGVHGHTAHLFGRGRGGSGRGWGGQAGWVAMQRRCLWETAGSPPWASCCTLHTEHVVAARASRKPKPCFQTKQAKPAHLGPAVALHAELVVAAARLEHGLLGTAAARHLAHRRAALAADHLRADQGSRQAGLVSGGTGWRKRETPKGSMRCPCACRHQTAATSVLQRPAAAQCWPVRFGPPSDWPLAPACCSHWLLAIPPNRWLPAAGRVIPALLHRARQSSPPPPAVLAPHARCFSEHTLLGAPA